MIIGCFGRYDLMHKYHLYDAQCTMLACTCIVYSNHIVLRIFPIAQAFTCPIKILAGWIIIVQIAELNELYLEDVILSCRSYKFAFLRNRLLAVVPHVTQWS
jgi:hypothetical protein